MNPQTDSGIPEPKWGCAPKPIWGSPNQNGDPRIPIPKRGSPNQNGDVNHKQSPNRFGDPRTEMGIPESPYKNGDPRTEMGMHPQTNLGIPESKWGSSDPHTKTGIPESVWGLVQSLTHSDLGFIPIWGPTELIPNRPQIGTAFKTGTPYRYGDPRIGLGRDLSIFQIGESP